MDNDFYQTDEKPDTSFGSVRNLFYSYFVRCRRLLRPRCLHPDGDTIEVLHNRHPERIRRSGIDCPEKGQSYGQRASKLGGHYFNGDLVDAGSWRLIDCAYYL